MWRTRLVDLFLQFQKFFSAFSVFFDGYDFKQIEKSLIIDLYFQNVPYGESNSEIKSIVSYFKEEAGLLLDCVYTGRAAAVLLNYAREETDKNALYCLWQTYSSETYENNEIRELIEKYKADPWLLEKKIPAEFLK